MIQNSGFLETSFSGTLILLGMWPAAASDLLTFLERWNSLDAFTMSMHVTLDFVSGLDAQVDAYII